MSWNHVIIEGFCFGEGTEIYPCRRDGVSSFCLGNGNSRSCPHFAWGQSSLEEAVIFLPIHVIFRAKIAQWARALWDSLSWQLWHRWFFRPEEFLGKIETCECPGLDRMLDKHDKDFIEWFESVKSYLEAQR